MASPSFWKTRCLSIDINGDSILRSECILQDWLQVQDTPLLLQEEPSVETTALADYLARILLRRDEELGSFRPLGCGKKRSRSENPYVLERTDVAIVVGADATSRMLVVHLVVPYDEQRNRCQEASQLLGELLASIDTRACLRHIGHVVLQERLRQAVQDRQAVAFVANGSILPRASGASSAPMASPPAIPFRAPDDSPLTHTLSVPVGRYFDTLDTSIPATRETTTNTLSLTGLLIPQGVSLIAGGGYHGKSTLLRCIATSVYGRIPGDGRECCVTLDSATCVRAEDGRYIHTTNISAFISNLPVPTDTRYFGSHEASGSTSQAANTIEALESGSRLLLVDEDVSAANFMARDGRMRALIQDESITPFLYRVNGLFRTHGVSSIVVVGGVGDWLDVPDAVILMKRYECFDGTAKARSISRQFSHGHVQYAGRGVVHRLDWPRTGDPLPRRPLLREAVDEDEDAIDLSRCEQLVGKEAHEVGCRLAALWILQQAQETTKASLPELLDQLDSQIRYYGWLSVCGDTIQLAVRPRRHEVAQALVRWRHVMFENLPEPQTDDTAEREAQRRKQELLELWKNRRT